jgi:hypothetical protein
MQRVRCSKCEAMILPSTASITGGLCMPCSKGRRVDPIPRQVWVTVRLDEVAFRVRAEDFLSEIEAVGPTGGETHPNRVEIAAQTALVRHAIRHRIDWELHNDHWNRAGYACCKLFDRGQAVLIVGQQEFTTEHTSRHDWREGTDPMMSRGGFSYLDSEGHELYRRQTWMS